MARKRPNIPKNLRRQPRLLDLRARLPLLAGLPEEVIAAIIMTAALEGISPQWVIGDILCAYFRLSHLSPTSVHHARERAEAREHQKQARRIARILRRR